MADECSNCGATVRAGSAFKAANDRKTEKAVAFVNFVLGGSYAELCTKCGDLPLAEAREVINREIAEKTVYCQEHIADFPMFTLSWLPATAKVKLKNMVTANITIGTGLFSEFSQGFSDMFGLVNENTGMSFKVNKGEAAARAILVMKAASVGANCIVGVDIDYGVTGNNAATVNMQGTAAFIENLSDILGDDELLMANAFNSAQSRISQLRRWKAGDLSA